MSVNVALLATGRTILILFLLKFAGLKKGVAPIVESGENGLGTLAEVRYNGHIKQC